VSFVRLGAFAVALVSGMVLEAWRWAILLAGLDVRAPLASLVAYRAAGHTIAGLIPSARMGGEPLRVYLLARAGVGTARAIATVGIDRTVEVGVGAPLGF